MDRTELLSQNSMFGSLSPGELDRIANLTTTETVAAGTVVFRQGDPGTVLYIIVSGAIKVFFTNEEEAEVAVAHLGPGDAVGEMAIFTGEPRSASIQAEEETSFLVLKKQDFDRILDENPGLARTFLEMVCRRLSNANLRLGEEAAREMALQEFLQDDIREAAQILGVTRQALQLRTQAEKAAANDQPLLITGEPGTEKLVVAQLVHEKSARAKKAFLCLDCGDVPAVVPQETSGVASGFLLEMAQFSALFGYQRGAFSFARSNRLGYLELADGGTLVLQNVERLAPAVQEKLLAYLQTLRLQRLGDSRETTSNVRIIATGHNGLLDDVTAGKFNPDLYAALSGLSIVIPPLRDRKKDLTAWVNHLIKMHSVRLGKEVEGITKEAMNLILAYDWPYNMEELGGVVQRGVRLADGRMLTPEQIFIGLAPFEPGKRVNLLKISLLQRVFQSRLYPGVIQTVSVGFLALILLSGLFGPQQAGSNVSLVLAWALWWPLLILGIFFTGRFFCGVCPMSSVASFIQGRWGLKRKVPAQLKQYGLYGAAAGFLLIIWVEQATNMASSPSATAFLLMAILAGAVGTSIVYDRSAWCRYMCPLGRMVGTYATMSVIELRTNGSVCTAECKTHGCYTGTERAPGCPMFEGAFALQSNDTCKICGNCIKSCANRAVRLNLRPPVAEAWSVPQHSMPMAVFVPILIATVMSMQLRSTGIYREWAAGLSMEWLVYLGVMIVLAATQWAVMALAALLLRGRDEPLTRSLAWIPYTFLPLAMAGEMSHQTGPLFSEAGSLLAVAARQLGLGGWQHMTFDASAAAPSIQVWLLGIGLIGSVYLAGHLQARYRPSAAGKVRLILYALAGLLALVYGLLLIGV